MVSSTELGFNLKALLEKLDQNELSEFKSLLKTFAQKNELQELPQMEVDTADRKQLAEILLNHCPSYWVDMVVIQAFRQMNRRDLWMKAKNELREAALASIDKNNNKNEPLWTGIEWKEGPEYENLEELLQHLEKQSERTEEEEVINLGKTKTFLEGEKPGKEDIYRSIVKKKFWKHWKNNWPGLSENIHDVTQRDKMLIPFCDPTMLPGPFPHTVVLYGPAGVGKTTLAKKLMLDWAENNLNQVFKYTFYLSCKELNHMGACSFAELIFKDWPEWQDDAAEVLAQAQKILFIIDGFEELRVPAGALIHDICGNWEREMPVPVLLGSLLKRKMLPKASLLVTTRPEALRELRLLVEQPLFIEMEGLLEPDRRAYFLRQFADQDFGCRMFLQIREELLKYRANFDENKPFSRTDMKELLYCLYESQDEGLVRGAMAPFKELSLHLNNKMDVIDSSFCLKHCQNLQKLALRVAKGIFLENDTALEPHTQLERSQDDQHILSFWTELCSIFGSNENLIFLKISQSFLSTSSVRILCEQIASATCNLQKVVLKNVSPADVYQNFCFTFIHNETLTNLTLQGNDQDDAFPSLCEILRHPKCNLQYLSLTSCSATTQQWVNLFLALETSQSLMNLILSDNHLLDKGVKLLLRALTHPKCCLERLSLENCYFTEACCKNLASVLIVSVRLTHLCLANNNLGDRGVKILCEGLSYPECRLQILVLWHCNITTDGCHHLSKILQQKTSLTHLDLGLNHLGIAGLKFLCEALKAPLCNLRCLWLWGCSITTFSCEDLSAILKSNQNLSTLDLGQNSLGSSGVKMLCKPLKHQKCPLQMLRLKMDESDVEIQKLLKEIQATNPHLTIENDNHDPRGKRPSSHYFIV
ncbi:NACHT, LRR and PYD domains-containing protein 2 [Otolemur garnettii]|uniref:NACHT, LRR and PYD domains-containing protein 2 n=1 Tax=Otolemur garnettii TaxID=30611 RepID=UPI000C7EDB4F|nr:NACHT, LRR and PYD domains-containing protein 2 [Otolemur garnettii]